MPTPKAPPFPPKYKPPTPAEVRASQRRHDMLLAMQGRFESMSKGFTRKLGPVRDKLRKAALAFAKNPKKGGRADLELTGAALAAVGTVVGEIGAAVPGLIEMLVKVDPEAFGKPTPKRRPRRPRRPGSR